MHERNYSVAEKDCLAVVWALFTIRPYLMGVHFIVYMDHFSLRLLMNMSNPLGHLMRCRLRLTELDLEVTYKNGEQNTQADALSRLLTNG